MLRRVALVGTDLSEAPGSSDWSVQTRATRRTNPEDTILHSHCRENLKSYNLKSYIELITYELTEMRHLIEGTRENHDKLRQNR
jgi:hypothetical protein